MKGRAEYENIKGKELFEGKSALSLYPWIQNKGYGVGGVFAERGEGKTFFIKKLAEEIPMIIHALNKETLEYEMVHEEYEKLKAIAVDDLHYMLQMMRLGYLEGKPSIEEEEVLQILKDINYDAKEKNIKLIFIADEGPGSLQHNFQEEKNKKEFLRLLKGCVVTPDDCTIMHQYLGECFLPSDNVCRLRHLIDDEMSVNIRKEFGMNDIPFIIPPIMNIERDITTGKMSYGKVSNLELRVLPNEAETVYHYNIDKHGNKYGYELIWTPSGLRDTWSFDFLNGQEKIISVREARILSDRLGGLNRENLSGSISMNKYELEGYSRSAIRELKMELKNRKRLTRSLKETEEGLETKPIELETANSGAWFYNLFNDVSRLRIILDNKYSEIIRKDYKLSPLRDLAGAIASANNDREVGIFYIVHELSRE